MEKCYNSKGKFAIRASLRTMEVGEIVNIPRELAKPSTMRSTCSQLNADFGVCYGTQATANGVDVIRSK